MINKKDLEINLGFCISTICLLPIHLLSADFIAFSIEMINRLLSKDFKSKVVNYVIMGQWESDKGIILKVDKVK